jgi:hypothetical protein
MYVSVIFIFLTEEFKKNLLLSSGYFFIFANGLLQ